MIAAAPAPAITLRPTRRVLTLVVTLAAGVAELQPVRPVPLIVVAGAWLLLGAPAVPLRRLTGRWATGRDTAWLLAAGLAVVADLVVALLVNTILPMAGLSHPLTVPALALAYTLAAIALTLAERRVTGASEPVRLTAPVLPHGLVPVGLLAAAGLLTAVAGTIRLNNGLGGGLSVFSLLLVASLLGLVLLRHRRYGGAVTALALYTAAASVLLLTSLRGWYITGHDIQREYLVYGLTESRQHWDIGVFRDAYNACLGVTLLPAAVTQLTGVSGLYAFKVVLPLLFALTPVVVYRTGAAVAAKPVALLGAIYFLAFPTFFTDMPFLGRQEAAFLLLSCAVLTLSGTKGSLAVRRTLFVTFVGGVVLSHYSTTYVLLAVLVLGKLAGHLIRLIAPLRRRMAERAPHERGGRVFVTWWMIGVIAGSAFLWTGPVTGTWQQVELTAAGALDDVFGEANQSGSSDVGYSIFGGSRVTPGQRLTDYAAGTVAKTGVAREHGDYAPLSTVDRYPVTAAAGPDQPLTPLGNALSGIGVPVAKLDAVVRQLCAYGLQFLLIVGLAGTVLARRRPGFRPSHDLFVLSAGSLLVLGVETLVPQLSVDYGVLRTFQQGLLVFAPFVAIASTWAFAWLGRARMPLAAAMSVAFFLELTGVVPAALGGYPAQLNLANAGQYYDIYYVHPQERAAIAWVSGRTALGRAGHVQSEVQTDRYTFSRLQTLIDGRADDDIFPTLVRTDSYVFLGYTTVTTGRTTVFSGGDLVTYRYPVAFLDDTKNKVYSSDGASVYR